MKFLKHIGLAAVLTAVMAGTAMAQAVDFYNDKANWEPSFEKVFEGAPVDVEVTPYADTSSYQAAVRSALRTPSAPGMFTWWSGYRMKDLVDAGLVADVSDIWKKYVDQGLYNPSLAAGYTFDGKIYAVPNNIAYWVVFYNKHVFDKYGLTPPKTWDEVIHIADTLKENGVTPFGQSIDGRWPAFIWFEEFLIRQDPELYKKLMNGQAKYTDPGVMEVFATWKEWIDKGYLSDPSLTMGTAGNNAMAGEFAKGNLGMILVGSWYLSTFTGQGLTSEDVGAFIMPNENPDLDPALIVETGPILVAAKSRQLDAAKQLADYWMSAEAQQIWVNEMDFPPINKNVTAKSELISQITKTVNEGNYDQLVRFWEATPPDIAEAAVDELGNFMLHPDTAEQVAQNLQAIADKYWSTHEK